MTNMIRQNIPLLEKTARYDPGGRALPGAAPYGLLEPAAAAMLESKRIVIVTGFCVRSAMTGETDGPPGAAILASALLNNNSQATIVTDKYSHKPIAAAMSALGIEAGVYILPDEEDKADEACSEILRDFRPDMAAAIERPGTAKDGHRYSMRGNTLDDIAPRADSFFTQKSRRSWATLAIGDGGNELGMGSLYENCAAYVPGGEKIFCVTPSDYPIVAGTSNWGAWALAGAMSLLAGKNLLPDPGAEMKILEAVYLAGAVDGTTGRKSMSVDGLNARDYIEPIKKIHNLVIENVARG